MTDEELKKQQAAGAPQPPQPMQAPTFSQMQSQGYARPAPQTQQQPGAMYSMKKDMPTDGDTGIPTDDNSTQVTSTSGTGETKPTGATNPTDPKAPVPFKPQGQQFASQLQSMFGDWKPQGQFQGQAQQTQAPTFQPGANPFQMPQGNATQLGQSYQPQGFNGSYNAQQAPTAQLTSQFQAPNNPLGAQTTGALQSFLSNPNGFNSDAVKQSYNYLSGNIDQDFNQKQLALRDEMAQRGLSESSINGERSNILLGNRRSAQEDLASRLLTQQAESQTGAQNAAIQAAMGYGNQNFNQGLSGYQANQGTNQQNFSQMLQNAAFQGDQNAMQLVQNMGIQGFNNQAGQQGFQNQIQGAQAQQGLDTGQLNNQLNVGGFNQNLANQGFQNQMQSAGFNANQNQQGFANQLAGYGANLQGNQQGFNQQQQMLNQLLGYEQQGFQNQLGTAQFNGSQQQWYQQLLAQLAQAGK